MRVDNQAWLWKKCGLLKSTSLFCGQFVNKHKTRIRRFQVVPTVVVLSIVVLLLLTSASIKPGWVVPGGTVAAAPGVLEVGGSKQKKFCALTFDDGPDKTFTMQVKEILDFYGIKATFFIVGKQATEYPRQIVALHKSGHEIANHSYSHPEFEKLPSAYRRSEIKQVNNLLEPLGITPKWFRPPYGSYNKATVNIAANHGLETVLWTLDPRDWETPGVEVIAQRVLTQTKNGEVILLHSTNAQTVAALPSIINGLTAKGYRFVTMSIWRDIVTGKMNVPVSQAPLNSPYPVDYSEERLSAMRVFLQTSKAAKVCVPDDVASPDWHGEAVPKTMIVYSNFKNQDECTEIHISGKGKQLSTFKSVELIPGSLNKFYDEFYDSLEISITPTNMYYHRVDGDNPDAHDTFEWSRPAVQPED